MKKGQCFLREMFDNFQAKYTIFNRLKNTLHYQI